jgi:hypothetical protein
VKWLKAEALSSNPNTTKKKKKRFCYPLDPENFTKIMQIKGSNP